MLYNKLMPSKKHGNFVKRISPSPSFWPKPLIFIKIKGIEKRTRNIVSKIDLKAIIEYGVSIEDSNSILEKQYKRHCMINLNILANM
jgi:hypothetical protein